MEAARHVQSTQNRKLVKFLQYIKKSITTVFDAKHSDMIFYGGPVMLIVTCFWVFVVKNGRSLSDHGTLKSGVSHK